MICKHSAISCQLSALILASSVEIIRWSTQYDHVRLRVKVVCQDNVPIQPNFNYCPLPPSKRWQIIAVMLIVLV